MGLSVEKWGNKYVLKFKLDKDNFVCVDSSVIANPNSHTPNDRIINTVLENECSQVQGETENSTKDKTEQKMNTNFLRPVLFTVKVIENNKVTHEISSEPGFFHAWGQTYEEFENGAVQFTHGIVEDYTGKIFEVLPQNILFVN